MVTETQNHPPELHLPVYDGDLRVYEEDVKDLLQALECGEDYKYEARLPQIIGYMPVDEVSAFAGTGNWFIGEKKCNPGLELKLEKEAPRTLQIICDDIETISKGASLLQSLQCRNQTNKTGQLVDGSDRVDVHNDLTTMTPESAHQAIYLVSNVNPTQFYEGSATLFYERGSYILDDSSLEPSALRQMVSAPPLAIVRMTYATIHAAPRATQTADRIFVRAHSKPFLRTN